MKRVLGMMVGGLLLGLAGIAVAQTEETAGLVQPLVVSIEQAVPVELTLAVAQSDGAVVTMTAPITVEVGLQIRIDGDQVVAVAPAAEAEAPAVAVTLEPVVASAPSEGFLIDDVVWRVVGVDSPGNVFDDPNDNYRALTTDAVFLVVEFEAENAGGTPASVDRDVDIFLQDGQGRLFEMYDGYFDDACFYVELNPGIADRCRMVFEVPPTAEGFEVVLGEAGVVPLTAE